MFLSFFMKVMEKLLYCCVDTFIGQLVLFGLLSVSKTKHTDWFCWKKKREERRGRGLRWWGVRVVRVRWPSSWSSYLCYGPVKQFGWPYPPAAPSASPRKSRTTSSFWPITSSFPTTTPTPPPSPPRFACFPQLPLFNSKQLWWCQNFHLDDAYITKTKTQCFKIDKNRSKGLAHFIGGGNRTCYLDLALDLFLFHLCDNQLLCL